MTNNPHARNSICYYLGAGASAKAIPTVAGGEMPDRFKVFALVFLFHEFGTKESVSPELWQKFIDIFPDNYIAVLDVFFRKNKDSIFFIMQICILMNDNLTIDEIYKKFYDELGKENIMFLSCLKKIIENYIQFEQKISNDKFNQFIVFFSTLPELFLWGFKNAIDKKYLEMVDIIRTVHVHKIVSYLSSNLTTYSIFELKSTDRNFDTVDDRYIKFLNVIVLGSDLHKKLQIVSWNYDTQLTEAARLLNIFSTPEFIKLENNEFKLNGSINTGFQLDGRRNFASKGGLYFKVGIDFAFEFPKGNTHRADRLIKKWNQGEVGFNDIIIIGYSFPQFNRDIDRKLITDILYRKLRFLKAKIGIHEVKLEPNCRSFNLYRYREDGTQIDILKVSGTELQSYLPKISIVETSNKNYEGVVQILKDFLPLQVAELLKFEWQMDIEKFYIPPSY